MDASSATATTPPSVAPQCVICGTALDGPLSYLFRAVGISRSSRNPNLCNRCNTHTEEGRLVELTVLFADLSSFTELTHELGPERTHEVVDAFLRMATSVLVRHAGFIDKYVGDAVMAFFNAPIRHEDHAARAVTAALEIEAELPDLRERFGLDLQASIGISSGWARVGRLGSADGKDYTAVGDVVNLAARLEGWAAPGEVIVDESVYQHVAAAFPHVIGEALPLKGFPEPVLSYRLGSAPHSRQHAPVRLEAEETKPRRAFGLGAVVFAVLGAPCAAIALIGPLAVILGAGSLFAALSANVLSVLDSAPIRIPVLTLATLGALANLYTLWHARKLREQAESDGRLIPLTRLEQRRSALVAGSAGLTLLIVAFELYAHGNITNHPWP
jgi:adenylate cyclase